MTNREDDEDMEGTGLNPDPENPSAPAYAVTRQLVPLVSGIRSIQRRMRSSLQQYE